MKKNYSYLEQEDYYAWLAKTLFDFAQSRGSALDITHFCPDDNTGQKKSIQELLAGEGLWITQGRPTNPSPILFDLSLEQVHTYLKKGIKFASHYESGEYIDAVLGAAIEYPEIFKALMSDKNKPLDEVYFGNILNLFERMSSEQRLLMLSNCFLTHYDKMSEEVIAFLIDVDDKNALLAYLLTYEKDVSLSHLEWLFILEQIQTKYGQELEFFRDFKLMAKYLENQNQSAFFIPDTHTVSLQFNTNKAIDIYALPEINSYDYITLIKSFLALCKKRNFQGIQSYAVEQKITQETMNIFVNTDKTNPLSQEKLAELIHDFLMTCKPVINMAVISTHSEAHQEFLKHIESWIMKKNLDDNLSIKNVVKKHKI